MAAINPSWTAGARSAQTLSGDGWFSFQVPAGAVGVSVGLGVEDTSTDPAEPTHGFLFESGQFRIWESGTARTSRVPFQSGDVFSIVRHGNQVLYCRGNPGSQVQRLGVPFLLPGAVVYASTVPVRSGALLLDAALLMPGDRVVDAQCVPVTGGATLRMQTLVLSASQGETAFASLRFEPLQVDTGIGNGAALAFLPMHARASEAERNDVSLAFLPMVVSVGEGRMDLRGADLQMQAPMATASGTGMSQDRADLSMTALALAAAQDTHAEARLQMAPLSAFAVALGTPALGPQFSVVLPAFTGGSSEQPAEDEVLESVALAGDDTYPSNYVLLVVEAWANDELLASMESAELVQDDALADEVLMLSGSILAQDEALAGDELLATASAMLAVDEAWADQELLGQSEGYASVTDEAVAVDEASAFLVSDVEDTALADDALQIVAEAMLGDEAWADDAVDPASLDAAALLVDEVLAGDDLLAQSDAVALLQDTAIASEALVMKTPGLVAWVMNADTGAVSWYDNWAFTDMAVVGGKVFASGPDGLVVLGGEGDGSDAIDARVEFGFNEFGGYNQSGMPKPSEAKKRIPALWFGYHASGVLEATVETYGQGYGAFRYAMQPRDAQQPRNNRIQPGKGLNARYWRIGIENTNGCAFEVHSIAAEVAASSRRL